MLLFPRCFKIKSLQNLKKHKDAVGVNLNAIVSKHFRGKQQAYTAQTTLTSIKHERDKIGWYLRRILEISCRRKIVYNSHTNSHLARGKQQAFFRWNRETWQCPDVGMLCQKRNFSKTLIISPPALELTNAFHKHLLVYNRCLFGRQLTPYTSVTGIKVRVERGLFRLVYG